MELMDYLTLDDAEDLYGIPVDKLIRYACNRSVSLAVRLSDLVGRSFINFESGRRHKLEDFSLCGGVPFGYYTHNISHPDEFLTGSTYTLGVTAFTEYPVGHPKHMGVQNTYSLAYDQHERIEGLSYDIQEQLRLDFFEKHCDEKIDFYLTRDAILNSKFMMSRLGIRAETVKLTSREKPQLIKIIEALHELNDTPMNTEGVDLLVHMKDLMIEYYGSELAIKDLTMKELIKDFNLGGLTTINRKTLSKYLRKAGL